MAKQFDPRYEIPKIFSANSGNLKRQHFIEEETGRSLASQLRRPSNISFFEKIMCSHWDSPKKKPRVGYFCNMIPQEIILALGAEPIRLDCGNAAASVVGEETLSGDVCPLAKASFGVFMNEESLANSCDVLVIPTSCDAKRKLGEILNAYKPTFMLNLPSEQNHQQYSKQSLAEICRLVEFLEQQLKTKLTASSLLRAVNLGRQRTSIVRDLQALRIAEPRSLSFCDLLLVIQSSIFRQIELSEWIKEASKLRDEAKEFKGEHKNLRPRLILTGSPMIWPNFKLARIIEESGAEIVADTLCTGAQSCFDPLVLDETGRNALLAALVNKYIYASICPCFVSQATRLNRILSLASESKADGIINYSLRLCQLFDMETFRLEKTIKSQKIPFLNIRTDYSLEDTEQLRVRIEAFLETL
ncbi:MAG: hypothetical protein A2X49_05420 [Lentisphaerae bacterium GWF2_52_8]|nr:MAG: hypothetical protein A2X49_05420 [Lentisphaerae bacterium GWF2_52_8]